VDLLIEQHGRSHIAGTYTVCQFEGKLAVGCGLAGQDSDLLGYAVNDQFRMLQIAGYAFANSNDISTQWPGGKIRNRMWSRRIPR